MKRLTFEGLFCDIAKCDRTPGGTFCESGTCTQRRVWERLKEYEDTGLEPDQIYRAQETLLCFDNIGIKRGNEIVSAEQDGRLVVLPCKVGDIVFHVRRVTQAEAKRMGVTPRYGRIIYYEDRPFAIKEKLCTKSDYAQIGKTVFLTREEAEAALKGGDDNA